MDACNERQSPPPRQFGSDILRIKSQQEGEYIVLADKFQGLEQHWVMQGKGFSQPCTSDAGPCRWCKENQSKRWRAYLWVVEYRNTRSKDFGFLELPGGSISQLELELSGLPWIGQVITVRRGKGATSPLTIWKRQQQPVRVAADMPVNRDVRPILHALWEKSLAKVNGVRLHVENDSPQTRKEGAA